MTRYRYAIRSRKSISTMIHHTQPMKGSSLQKPNAPAGLP